MKKLFIVSIFLLSSFLVDAQTPIDSLRNVLNYEKTDTTTLKKYQRLMAETYKEDLEMQELIGGWIIKNAEASGNLKILAESYKSLGISNQEAFKHKIATNYLTKAISIAEKNNFKEIHCLALIGLGRVYIDNEQQQEAIQYLNQALKIAKENNFMKAISFGSFELSTLIEGMTPKQNKKYDKKTIEQIISLKKDALQASIKLKDSTGIFTSYLGLAESLSNFKLFDSAFVYVDAAKYLLKKDIDNSQKLFYIAILAKVNKEKGEYYHTIPEFKKAVEFTLKALSLAQKLKLPQWQGFLLKGLGEEYKGLGDNKNSVLYYEKYIVLHDSLTEAQNLSEITEIKTKYETQKKETEILKLNQENLKKSTQNKILIGLTLGLLGLAFLGYRNFRNRQKIAEQNEVLQQQKITELEKDKQLLAVDAMLKGQEDERNRIAKDLHDGLGGMLSGVKMSFINMKENLIMSSENVVVFEQSISQLDNTIVELRKVAHNLMPEALVKFGLNDAINDFCRSMTTATHIPIVYESMGEPRKLDNTANVYIYRIIQELVNNAIKHGQPNQVFVQMTTTPNKILITVEDDGKGLDVNKLASSKGIGITNIKHRVNYFKGQLEFDSKTPNGTVVNIELNV